MWADLAVHPIRRDTTASQQEVTNVAALTFVLSSSDPNLSNFSRDAPIPVLVPKLLLGIGTEATTRYWYRDQ